MSEQSAISSVVPNGSGAAAISSAGIGMVFVAVLSIVANKSTVAQGLLTIYTASGALSGVTTVAIIIWLAAWVSLEIRWRRRTVSLKRVNIIAFVLLGISLLLTFPPVGKLF